MARDLSRNVSAKSSLSLADVSLLMYIVHVHAM